MLFILSTGICGKFRMFFFAIICLPTRCCWVVVVLSDPTTVSNTWHAYSMNGFSNLKFSVFTYRIRSSYRCLKLGSLAMKTALMSLLGCLCLGSSFVASLLQLVVASSASFGSSLVRKLVRPSRWAWNVRSQACYSVLGRITGQSTSYLIGSHLLRGATDLGHLLTWAAPNLDLLSTSKSML